MKIIFFFEILFFTSIVFADHASHHHLVKDKVNMIESPILKAGVIDIDGELITIIANGLVCDFCAQAIEKVFMRRDEVSGIDVDLSESRIVISTKKNKTINEDLLRKLITDSGYNVESIIRSSP